MLYITIHNFNVQLSLSNSKSTYNTKQEFTNYCKVFCDAVEHAGYDPMIYSNMKWMAFTLDMSELSAIEGFDEDVAKELQSRAKILH